MLKNTVSKTVLMSYEKGSFLFYCPQNLNNDHYNRFIAKGLGDGSLIGGAKFLPSGEITFPLDPDEPDGEHVPTGIKLPGNLTGGPVEIVIQVRYSSVHARESECLADLIDRRGWAAFLAGWLPRPNLSRGCAAISQGPCHAAATAGRSLLGAITEMIQAVNPGDTARNHLIAASKACGWDPHVSFIAAVYGA